MPCVSTAFRLDVIHNGESWGIRLVIDVILVSIFLYFCPNYSNGTAVEFQRKSTQKNKTFRKCIYLGERGVGGWCTHSASSIRCVAWVLHACGDKKNTIIVQKREGERSNSPRDSPCAGQVPAWKWNFLLSELSDSEKKRNFLVQ